VSAPGIRTENLHHDWDNRVRGAARSRRDRQRQSAHRTDHGRKSAGSGRAGTPVEWALESFSVAKTHAYGLLPAPYEPHHFQLAESYVVDAIGITAEQLSKAGVRLAFVLNQALEYNGMLRGRRRCRQGGASRR